MYSAPPKYHVRGAAINLILQKGSIDRPNLQAEANASYIQRHSGNLSSGVSVVYSSPEITTDLLYSIQDKNTRNGLALNSLHLLDGKYYGIEQQNRGKNHDVTHNIRLGLEYNITESDKLDLEYTTELVPVSNKKEFSTGNLSNSWNERDRDNNMQNIGLDYSS
jgi:hypothetical protein